MIDKKTHTRDTVKQRKAIALKDRTTDGKAISIAAKGRGYLADRILDIAFENDIKVRQDKALTDILDAYDVESPVPFEALNAVSLLLEYVYKANLQEERRKNRASIKDKFSLNSDPIDPSADNNEGAVDVPSRTVNTPDHTDKE